MNESPRFFSRAFHLKFFPSVVWGLFRLKRMAPRSGLSGHLGGHIPIEFTILTVLSAWAGLFGLMAAIGNNSIPGWIFGTAGISVFTGLLVFSIRSEAGTRPSFESFSIAVFFFFVTLGITAGLFIGAVEHSRRLGLIGVFAGLAAGYVAGTFAGLWVQRLGWMAKFFEMLAGAAVIGLVVVALVLFWG